MFAKLSYLADKYFKDAGSGSVFSNTSIPSSGPINGNLNASNGSKVVSKSSDLTEMFPYLEGFDKNNTSFLSNAANMMKALYRVSKISSNSGKILDSQVADESGEISSALNTLQNMEFTFFFKVLFKYVFSQFSFICILNAFFLNKVSHMAERNTQHRRTTIRLQLARQQLVSRRDEISRSLNDTNTVARDVLESELLVIVAQLQDINQQLLNQQLLEEEELEKEKSRVNFYKLFGMGLHILNILVMCYLVYFCEYKMFKLNTESFNAVLVKYCSAVFYMVNWLECCIALNNQFNLLPHRKSILKYEGFTTFDYSLVLFISHHYFFVGDFEKHTNLFKFFVYNKLIYEIVTITLEIFQLKHYWLFLSFGIDIFFLRWFVRIVSSGCFGSWSIFSDPVVILSGILLFLLYVPLIISYVFSIMTVLAFLVVAAALKFKNLKTLKYYQVFKNFKTHLSSCEGSEITADANLDDISSWKRLGTLNFNRSILQFCVFIMMNENNNQAFSQENYVLRAINKLYDSEFGYINKYITKRRNLSREFKTYPLSLNEMHFENLLSHTSKNIKHKSALRTQNHLVSDRLGESSAGFWSILLRPDRTGNFINFVKNFGKLRKIVQKLDSTALQEVNKEHVDHKECASQDEFEDDYVNILNSDGSAFALDDSLDYIPLAETDIISSEEDEEEEENEETVKNMLEELKNLLPSTPDILMSTVQSSEQQKLDFDTFIDVVKRQEVFNKVSEVITLPHFTRSYYKKYLDNNVVLDVKHELKKRHNYYAELKPVSGLEECSEEEEEDEENYDDFSSDCVICTVNKRAIILWPCKCLAICDDCRVSLSIKNFDHCPCCRTKIKGFSKINNV